MSQTPETLGSKLFQVRQHMFRISLIQLDGVLPGTRQFRAYARCFMPLRVSLGEVVESQDVVTWEPGREANGFFLILGASGSGKTETLKLVGRKLLEHGIPVLVLDFHGDVLVPGLNTVLMSSGTASWAGVNPMEIDSDRAEQVGLYDQRMALLDLLSRAIPQLGHQQRSVLADAIREAYLRAGIFDDDPSTWGRPPPTFEWVLAILAEWSGEEGPRRRTILACISVVEAVFGHPLFSRGTHLSLQDILEAGLRIDLSKVAESIRFLVADTILRKLFRMLSLHGPIPVDPDSDVERFRLFVIIDEAKILSAGSGDPDDSRLVLNLLATEARKFGIGLVLASQMREHFGAEVRANAATRLVLKPMDWLQAKRNAIDIGVAPEALVQLGGRGEGYFQSRDNRIIQRIQVRRL